MPYESRPKGDPRSAVYASARWRKVTRPYVLERDGYTCRMCGYPGKIVDHHPTPLLDILRAGGDPYDAAGCRTLCLKCSGHTDGKRAPKAPSQRRAVERHPGFVD